MATQKSGKPIPAIRNIQDIYTRAGSAAHLAIALGYKTSNAVELWSIRGIPQRHWESLENLYGVLPAECYSINLALRKKYKGE